GWRMHRIWSTDWWFDRAGETKRLRAALEAARAAPRPVPPSRSPAAEPTPERAPPPRPAREAAPSPPAPPARPYIQAALTIASERPDDFHLPTSRALIQLRLATAVAEEGPIHAD